MTEQHMTHEWITDRLPTEADADGEGDVRVPRDSEGTAWWFQHYSLIVPGQPWWSHRTPERVEVEPAPALVVAVGQQWRRRNGEVVTITQLDPGTDHDLIELVSGPAPAPAREVDRLEAVGGFLYAVCNDGTMWRLTFPGWAQLPAIPQPGA